VNEKEANESDFTKNIIKYARDTGDERSDFFRAIVKLMNQQNNSNFWNEVAFGNLIQRGFRNSGEQPTQADYTSVKKVFEQMVKEIQPKKIIIFSKRIWDYHLGEQGFEKIQSPEPLLQDVFWYTQENQRYLTMGTWHPSSIYVRNNKQKATELIRAFMQYSM